MGRGWICEPIGRWILKRRGCQLATEEDFHRCVAALDDVTGAFLEARKNCPGLSEYESDRSAFQLMEAVFRNVNAISTIAMIPAAGTHLFPAWVLIRSSFEIALTAYWLAKEDDWKEREARWIGWIAGEEQFQKRLANDLRPVAGTTAEPLSVYADALEHRRRAIMAKLPKDSRTNRPTIPSMLSECGIDQHYYAVYRIGSQLAHGGHTTCSELFAQEDGGFRLKDVAYASWIEPFQIAGWSVAQAGAVVLARIGMSSISLEPLAVAQDSLISATSILKT